MSWLIILRVLVSAWREVSNQKATALSLSFDVASVQMNPSAANKDMDGTLIKSYEIYSAYESKKQDTWHPTLQYTSEKQFKLWLFDFQ